MRRFWKDDRNVIGFAKLGLFWNYPVGQMFKGFIAAFFEKIWKNSKFTLATYKLRVNLTQKFPNLKACTFISEKLPHKLLNEMSFFELFCRASTEPVFSRENQDTKISSVILCGLQNGAKNALLE